MSAPAVLPVRKKFTSRSSTCACRIEGASKCSPAAAVPVRTKIPDPIIAPIPSAIMDHGPRALRSRCSGCSASASSLSMDLQQRSWLGFVAGSVRSVVDDSPNGPRSKQECGCPTLFAFFATGWEPHPLDVISSPVRAPSSLLCASVIRERTPGASTDVGFCAFYGQCVLLFCVRLC